MRRPDSFAILLLVAIGCSDNPSTERDAASEDAADAADASDSAVVEDAGLDAADAEPDAADASTTRAFEITFRGVLGSENATCSGTYAGFGPAQDQSITLKDFRFYVHAVELLTSGGAAVPLVLDEEAPFQRAGVALLDFEDKTGDCVNGTEATRSVVRGQAPAGAYMGIRFVLGVPFDQNHQDRSIAAAPLDLSQMFWSWAGGYIFARFDLFTTEVDGGVRATSGAHLGSTNCNGSPSSMPSSACEHPNRPVITLSGFDPDADVILVDPKALMEGVDLTFNTPGTGSGCMAGRADPECALVMPRFGLAFGETPAGQTLFRVEE